MNIHEYQTKELLRGYGIPVPNGRVAHNVDNAATIAEDLGGERWVVKAQRKPFKYSHVGFLNEMSHKKTDK